MAEQPDYMAAFRSLRDKANRMLGTHQHEWDVVDTWRPEQRQPIHPRMQGTVPSTFVLVICKLCHLPETIELEGIWTTEQVRGQARSSSSEQQ